MDKRLGKLLVALALYTGFAVYLYQPYFKNFGKADYLIVFNSIAGALGCYVLSRRWVVDFGASFFAGAVYGFGPLVLSLAKFHPTAGFMAAMVPWLFCPAVFGPRWKWRWLRVPLSVLPVITIILFFQAANAMRLFPVPVQAKLQVTEFAGMAAVLVMVERCVVAVGVYHVPLAAMVLGFSMLITARRFGAMVIFVVGLVLSFCAPVLGVSPVMWLTLPVVCCAVGVGEGLQGLLYASKADRKWLLYGVVMMAVLAGVMMLFAVKYYQVFAGMGEGYARIFSETAKMYALGMVAMGIVFFMASAKLRIHWVRVVLLCVAIAVDIFVGARFIVDSIF